MEYIDTLGHAFRPGQLDARFNDPQHANEQSRAEHRQSHTECNKCVHDYAFIGSINGAGYDL